MSRPHYIYDWEEWKEFCERQEIDPYENYEHGFDLGGGDSFNVEYVGDVPKRKKNE